MPWGKSIFPRFGIDRPMPAGTKPPCPGEAPLEDPGGQLPVEIANAIGHANFTAFVLGLQTCDDLDAEEHCRAKFKAALNDLNAIVLKHLRGEA